MLQCRQKNQENNSLPTELFHAIKMLKPYVAYLNQ